MVQKITYFCLLFLLCSFKSQGARGNSSFYFQQLDNSNGLSNSAVNVVYEDKDLLLWAGTWDGLNMFDGTDFKVYNYTNNRSGSNGIGSNVIQDITEGQDGNIWVNTIGGITRIDKRGGELHQYFYNNSSRRKITEKEFELVADSLGQVFCYSKTEGLLRFDPIKDTFVKINIPSQNRKVIKMALDKRGLLWLLQDNGELAVCKYYGNRLRALRVIKHPSGIDNFFYVGDMLYLYCNGYLYSETKDTFVRTNRKLTGIKSICSYNSYYLVLFENQELRVYDKYFRSSSFMAGELKKLAGIKVLHVLSSKEGTLWMGTDGNGLIRIYPKKNLFGLISKAEEAAFNKPARAFCEAEGDLWIGTKGKGIIRLKDFWTTDKNKLQSSILNTAGGLNNNSVYALKKSYPYVYIGTDGAGINIYDLNSKRLIQWSDIDGSAKLPPFSSVYAIQKDSDGSLWLGTSGSGLIHLQLGTTTTGTLFIKSFGQYLSEKTEGLANDIIYAISNTDERHLWIACRYGGLSVLDKENGRFKTFKAFGGQNSLSNNDVLSLYCDKQKGLWIGTSFGLNYLSYRESLKEKPQFVGFTMDDGLPNNTIHAIEEGGNGDIWLSTNKGLARLRAGTNIITTYNENDGLQSNEFSDGAVWKSNTGYLFFGGIYGFNFFLPQNIRGDSRQPNLLVSQLQVGGKSTNENRIQVLRSAKDEVPEYVAEREMNFFRLNLKSISFINPVKNEFSYKLEGIDKNWNYSATNGSIVYNSIPPGHYTLFVRWSNAEGNWTIPTPVFKLRIKQYIWLSYPALGLYLTVLIISGYLFHLYRKNKLEMKYKLEMEYHLRQKDESIHQQRLNFFTNIAHEIQTPLTLITGSVEHFLVSRKNELLKNKENNYFLSLVYQHSVRLTYLVQQLLEFRKAEAGFLKRTDHYIDISKMLNSLTSLFITESRKLGKPYNREIQDGIAGFVDKDKLEKILFNLLSNAFKHSGPQDAVTFKASYSKKRNELCIRVVNAGCKLTDEDVKLLFNKFYTKDGSSYEKPSTGIGLSFAKELATLLKASISVELHAGTIEFILCLPVKTSSGEVDENEVATSAPSYLYESLLQHYEQPVLLNSDEGNKISLIDELHQKTKHSILIVEDNLELRYLIHQVLKDQYIVYEAGNGEEALALLKKNMPDLIISDVMMPGMDGLELCREVKNTPATAQIPFIILSAKGTEENKEEGYEVGADAYIPKPFNINYLQVRVRKLIDYRSRMKELVKDQNISSQFMNTDIAEADKAFLESILKVIENNLDEPGLNANTIESALSISKMQLYRKLKSLAGMTPAEFIKRIRLKHAADMLRNSQYTVSEIIYRTGFNSKSYFFREFKKIYQCAPNDYRAKQFEANIQDS
ncbi:two component regulator with propeller domain [Arcticibacter tournemirensis]|uniref:histidine kinase n=1 Tax=Arcticibacter tournemirensis TaxID=699437 RepID=A0A5M9GW14_9SPHI|nr:two-component regulator propeller domain-containing protein [Arcticibacter tournemirensis]KAA8477951.1 response regulator [Arcticibacter tournemirensis]TQM48425.1 two component regulator with propeller domain [Arcticibacter tournemirensis]